MYNNLIVQEDLKSILKQNINFEKFKNKKILITGATGMLASYYMYTLMYLNDVLNYNIKIYALVRNNEKLKSITNYEKRKDITPIIQDVCNSIDIDEKIDYIIHMASSANPSTIITNPIGIINANIKGTLNVLECAKKHNAEVIFTSTREVYGEMNENKKEIKEDDMGVLNNLELRACYPESKRMAENIIISYAYQFGIEYQIARIAHSYGPGMIIENDGRIMSDLIYNVIKGENIVLKSKGEAKRAFCYILDATTALLRITINENKNQVYNIANEKEEISIKDLAYLLKEKYKEKNIDVIFEIKDNNNQYVRFKRTKLNTDKLEKLGWEPIVNLEEGIYRTVNFFNK
jgi:UDP-glucuronate decarboxylase